MTTMASSVRYHAVNNTILSQLLANCTDGVFDEDVKTCKELTTVREDPPLPAEIIYMDYILGKLIYFIFVNKFFGKLGKLGLLQF